MPFVPTPDGASIYYRSLGHGPTKVLHLMGLYGRHVDFFLQLEWFGVFKADQYTVVAIDHRGTGFSLEPGQGSAESHLRDSSSSGSGPEGEEGDEDNYIVDHAYVVTK